MPTAASSLRAPRHWGTIAEAGIALAAASALTRLLPFHRFISLGARPLPARGREADATIARIVDALADRIPFRAVCLQRGIALQWMLRRRGVDAVLHYGIELPGDETELSAHVWVSVDEKVVIGAPQHQRCTEVARYPALR